LQFFRKLGQKLKVLGGQKKNQGNGMGLNAGKAQSPGGGGIRLRTAQEDRVQYKLKDAVGGGARRRKSEAVAYEYHNWEKGWSVKGGQIFGRGEIGKMFPAGPELEIFANSGGETIPRRGSAMGVPTAPLLSQKRTSPSLLYTLAGEKGLKL